MFAEYTRRDITYASDTLLAFVGIGNILTSLFGTELCYGLPTAFFDRAILWKSVEGPSKRRLHFPSWCWAGFEGLKTFLHHTQSNGEFWVWLRQETWIKWSLMDKNGRNPVGLLPNAEANHGSSSSIPPDQQADMRTFDHQI